MPSKSRPSRPEVKSCCPQSDEEILQAYLGGAEAAPTASKRKPPPQPRSRAASAASWRQVGVAGFAARVAAGGAAVATTGSADEGGEACVSWRGPRQPSSPRAQSLPVSHSRLRLLFSRFLTRGLFAGAGPQCSEEALKAPGSCFLSPSNVEPGIGDGHHSPTTVVKWGTPGRGTYPRPHRPRSPPQVLLPAASRSSTVSPFPTTTACANICRLRFGCGADAAAVGTKNRRPRSVALGLPGQTACRSTRTATREPLRPP